MTCLLPVLGQLPALWDLVGLEKGQESVAQPCFGNTASLPTCSRTKHGWGERPARSCSPSFSVLSCFCCSVALGYRCKSKRRCFAPAAFYKPFGEEAAGALTLSQFQALQESNKETASLRELGLSDSEILLWKNRASTGKVGILCSDVTWPSPSNPMACGTLVENSSPL